MDKRGSPARRVAVRVLYRVIDAGAWTAPALDAEIARAKLDARDASLATEIAYGALRVLPLLTAALDAHLDKPRKLDPFIRAVLIAGAYQLRHLRVPPHAAVSDAVAIAKSERGPRMGGLVNAVLRKIERPADPTPPRAIALPAWLEAKVRESLDDRSDAFLTARSLPPPIGLRTADPVALARAIRDARPDAEVGVAGSAVWIKNAGDPRALPGYRDGAFAVQELGSQRIVELADVRPGMRVADLCAGHGTKSLAFAARGAEVVAVDLYEEKLERLERERARLLPNAKIETRACDLTVGVGGLRADFDRVLVDAPCTGLGTVHRRPEIALRIREGDPERMAELQIAIATRAASLVKPGGALIYAVCSPMSAEGIGVVERLEAAVPALRRDSFVRIGPWEDGEPDAYQVSHWAV